MTDSAYTAFWDDHGRDLNNQGYRAAFETTEAALAATEDPAAPAAPASSTYGPWRPGDAVITDDAEVWLCTDSHPDRFMGCRWVNAHEQRRDDTAIDLHHPVLLARTGQRIATG